MELGTLSRWFLDSRRTIQYGGQDVEMSHAGKTHLHVAGVYFLVIFFPHLVSWFSKVNEMYVLLKTTISITTFTGNTSEWVFIIASI